MKLRNKKWTTNEFLKVRKQVLETWPTGSSPLLNLDIAVDYLKKIPKEKNFALKLAQAKKEGRTYVQPRAGVATLKENIALLQKLEKAGADFLPSTIPSCSSSSGFSPTTAWMSVWNRPESTGFPFTISWRIRSGSPSPIPNGFVRLKAIRTMSRILNGSATFSG